MGSRSWVVGPPSPHWYQCSSWSKGDFHNCQVQEVQTGFGDESLAVLLLICLEIWITPQFPVASLRGDFPPSEGCSWGRLRSVIHWSHYCWIVISGLTGLQHGPLISVIEIDKCKKGIILINPSHLSPLANAFLQSNNMVSLLLSSSRGIRLSLSQLFLVFAPLLSLGEAFTRRCYPWHWLALSEFRFYNMKSVNNMDWTENVIAEHNGR